MSGLPRDANDFNFQVNSPIGELQVRGSPMPRFVACLQSLPNANRRSFVRDINLVTFWAIGTRSTTKVIPRLFFLMTRKISIDTSTRTRRRLCFFCKCNHGFPSGILQLEPHRQSDY